MSKIEAFRSVFEESLTDIADRTTNNASAGGGCCLILSGGVDTCAILAAAAKLGIKYDAAVTVVTDESSSPDFGFATAAASQYGWLEHHVVQLSAQELVTKYLPVCVELLETFDGMTLRNSLVVAAALQKVVEIQPECRHVVVGDGADELFGGYSFMWGCADDPAQWKEKRDSMCAKWTFATETLANHYGLTSHSPFTAQKTVDWAIENTERSDCIGVRPIRLVFGGEAVEHKTGKLLLREAYDTVASWRRKDPIEVGSGVTIIGKDDFWKDLLPDCDFATEKEDLVQQGFVIKDKEHLINFRAFKECFKADGSGLSTKRRLEIGSGCAGCCFEIGKSSFCKICGAFPAQRS